MQQTHRVKDCQKDGGLGNLEKKHLLLILQKENKASFHMLGREKASPPLPPLAVSRVENCDSCLTK